jgi:hypothetical protein
MLLRTHEVIHENRWGWKTYCTLKEQIKLRQLTSTFVFRCTVNIQGILSFVKNVSWKSFREKRLVKNVSWKSFCEKRFVKIVSWKTFRENRLVKNILQLRPEWSFALSYTFFQAMRIKLHEEIIHKNLLAVCEFYWNLCSGSHTSHLGVNKFRTRFPVFFSWI